MAQNFFADVELMTKELTDETRHHMTTNVSSEYEQYWGDSLLQMCSKSVLDGDVFEAAQEVVVVQTVKVLAHLPLKIQTGKENPMPMPMMNEFEHSCPKSSFLVFESPLCLSGQRSYS